MPVSSDVATVCVTPSVSKQDKHAEMKRKGEEKRRLLAVLTNTPLSVVPSVQSEEKLIRKKEMKRKFLEASQKTVPDETSRSGSSVIKTSVLATTITKRTEHKRQKMRERERQKRTKLAEKKEEKHQDDSTRKRIDNQPVFGEVIHRPSDSIRDMGAKLALKFNKNKSVFDKAYNAIRKPLKN